MDDEIEEFKISKKVRAKLSDKEWLRKEFAKGKSGQEILGFSDHTMAKFYGAAYKMFEHRKYSDAANAFLFLVTINAFNHDYWLGLGMATQMLGDFEGAVDAYEMAAITDVNNPIPYFYLAKCLFAMHDRDSALEAINLALEYAGDEEKYADLKEQARAAKALLLKHK